MAKKKSIKSIPLKTRLSRRIQRQYVLGRAIRRHKALKPVENRTEWIRKDDLLAFVTLRNEVVRLPYFLDYYRKLGINHFLVVDNESTDGSRDYLAMQPDVSLWRCGVSYKAARYGMDWINWLLFRYGTGHWCLTVDPDEFFVYPHLETRPLRALTNWLDGAGHRSFSAMLLDMYPRGEIDEEIYQSGQNPFEIASYFDPINYTIRLNKKIRNLWIQGGPRARVFFEDNPLDAPALNKIPLVKWAWHYAYISSTHMALPASLNQVYDQTGGEMASGVLMHAKFLSTFAEKSAEELDRNQHYSDSQEYRAYHAGLTQNSQIWCSESVKYENWQQLEELGLISRGNWA